MRCTFLGTGTSHGIPVIACDCDCCKSTDFRDKRMRSSLWITDGDFNNPETSILIDIGPDFRSQALKFNIKKLDALLLTHSHADHLNGLDDIRIFSHTCSLEPIAEDGTKKEHPETFGDGLPVYGNNVTIQDLQHRFSYIFKPTKEGGGKPKIRAIDSSCFTTDFPLQINNVTLIPVPLFHGSLETCGWIIQNTLTKKCFIYLTDCNFIPKESINLLNKFHGKIECLVIDALRQRKHTTHFSFDEALEISLKIKSKQILFTHICHDLMHFQIQNYISDKIQTTSSLSELNNVESIAPAYDGLYLEF